MAGKDSKNVTLKFATLGTNKNSAFAKKEEKLYTIKCYSRMLKYEQISFI